MSRKPPGFATWVLKHFGSANEALAGDIVEEYAQGRSAAWYWRQVLIAVLFSCGNEVRKHKLLTVRSVIVGWTALYASGYAINLPVYKLYAKVLTALGLQPPWFWWRHYYTYPLVFLPLIGGLLSGWLVARLQRAHRTTMVLVYLMTVLLYSLPEWLRLTVDSFSNSRFLPYLLVHTLGYSFLTVGILSGGLWHDENPTPRRPQPSTLNCDRPSGPD